MQGKQAVGIALALGLFSASTIVQAVPVVLDSSTQCSAGMASNGISVSDVTGNVGGASDCWGTFNGNDPGPSGDGFTIGSMIFDYVAKQDMPNTVSGQPIGLVVSGANGNNNDAKSGTWAFDGNLFDPVSYLIVLKAANSPGYAAWLFEGNDAESTSGDWLVAWNKGLSHLSIYAKAGAPPVLVTEPSALLLVGVSLLAIGLRRRKR